MFFGKPERAEKHVEERVQVVAECGFDDAVVEDGPDIEQPV